MDSNQQTTSQSLAPAAPSAYPTSQQTPASQWEGVTPPHQGPIDSRDVSHWNQHLNDAINHPAAQLQRASPANAEEWHASYCGFCSPADLGVTTCCCTCFTFGQTHHRLRWGNRMENYESVNTSCLLFFLAECFGVPCIPIAMQRSDVRTKYNLRGNGFGDFCSAYWCPACDMMQQEKEVRYREALLDGQRGSVAHLQQYQAEGGMAYPPPAAQHNSEK